MTDEGIRFIPRSNGMIWGPYINLEEGDYICQFFLSDTHSHPEMMFSYDVCADHGRKLLVERSRISRNEQGIYINLTLLEPQDSIEFRLYYSGEEAETITGVHIFRSDNQPMKTQPDTYLIEKSKDLFEQASLMQAAPQRKSFYEVLILQTADANRYAKMLAVSSAINKAYCQRWGMAYESFSGVIFGNKSFQAMYNRTALLWFLMERGYHGWVLYLDADAVVSDFNFDFKSYLLNKRKVGKQMIFHPVHDHGHDLQFFGHVNDGAFAMDLSGSTARALISTWYSFYQEFYGEKDYDEAKLWTDLLDDQASLQRILFANRETLRHCIDFDPLQRDKIYQALRSDHSNESTKDDLECRFGALHGIGLALGVIKPVLIA